MTFTNEQLIGIGVVAVVGLWYLSSRGAQAVKDVGNAINPTNPENVFYEGVNSTGEALTGDEDFTLGGWLYESINGVDG